MLAHSMLLGQKLDTLVQKFLRATRYNVGAMNTQTVLATAKALVKRYPFLEKVHLGQRVYFAVWVLFCAERLSKRNRIEISPPNCQLCREVPDTIITNYQLRSDTSNTMKKRDKKRSNLWNR